MLGFFGAIGKHPARINDSELLDFWPSSSTATITAVGSTARVARFCPGSLSDTSFTAWSPRRRFFVCLDGYLIMAGHETLHGLDAHLRLFAERLETDDVPAALSEIISGAYALLIIDGVTRSAHLVTDPHGSQPAYYSGIDGGWLVSTNPVALARSGRVDTSPDLTACAEWALFSYALGDRYPIKGIRTMRTGSILTMDIASGRHTMETFENFWEIEPRPITPPVERIAEAFRLACRRLQAIDAAPAHLQSSGMDSRLITASWPEDYNPTCFTYGDPGAHEIRIAGRIAAERGSEWIHSWQHGDDVSDRLDAIFDDSGAIVWPDRYFVAETMAARGYRGVLDGLGGDALLGGSVYGYNHYFGRLRALTRLLGTTVDARVSRIGLDAIAAALFDYLHQVRDPACFEDFVSADFVAMLRAEKENITADIRADLDVISPATDSLAVLWRNVLMYNRGPHLTVQQGVMCKRFVNVYYPFTNDTEFFRLALSLRPQDTAFRRYYLKLYRRCHPRYARIPYGATLIPLGRPFANHKLSALLLSKNLSIPGLTGSADGRQRDPNGWGIWMAESGKLREYVTEGLRAGGIIDEDRCRVSIGRIARGDRRGGGKLLHLVAIAKWLTSRKQSMQPRHNVYSDSGSLGSRPA